MNRKRMTIRELVQFLLLNADLNDYACFTDGRRIIDIEQDEDGRIWLGKLHMASEER